MVVAVAQEVFVQNKNPVQYRNRTRYRTIILPVFPIISCKIMKWNRVYVRTHLKKGTEKVRYATVRYRTETIDSGIEIYGNLIER